ncbi:MAG: hypothetical protein IPK55_10400 [Streptococcus sp.]|nr:hypothetical protein [Streptococcus sp.]
MEEYRIPVFEKYLRDAIEFIDLRSPKKGANRDFQKYKNDVRTQLIEKIKVLKQRLNKYKKRLEANTVSIKLSNEEGEYIKS